MSDLSDIWNGITGNDTKTVTSTEVKPNNTGLIIVGVVLVILVIVAVFVYGKKSKSTA